MCIRYAIRRVEANQEDLQSNGEHQRPVFADVYMLGGRIHTVKESTGFVFAS